MGLSLALSSNFIPIHFIFSPAEWERRVIRNLWTLISLSRIDGKHKYYFDTKESRFYKSTWTIAENLRWLIGNWASTRLAQGEEVLYRTLWRLSITDTVEGIQIVKQQIIRTLAIASRSLYSTQKEVNIDLQLLENHIRSIQQELVKANAGLLRLSEKYDQEEDKKFLLKPVVDDFTKELTEFANRVLAQIGECKQKKGMLPWSKPVEVVKQPSPIPLEEKWDLKLVGQAATGLTPSIKKEDILNLPPPTPFFNIKTDNQMSFNSNCQQNFHQMQKYLEEHLDTLLTEVKTIEGLRLYNGKSPKMPFSLLISKEGKIYFHYHISIVPKGEGGNFKSDERSYSVHRAVDIASLTTKLFDQKMVDMAKNEEKHLLWCTEKNLPNVVKTYDIFWLIDDKGVMEQQIYQHYYSHGALKDSLERLKNQPEKLKKILIGVMRGLAALHAEKIVHRDLKPGNILLDENDEARIGDFGFACQENEEPPLQASILYMDPDMLDQARGKLHHDIWSLGMMMYQLLTDPSSEMPWPWLKHAKNLFDVLERHKYAKEKQFPEPNQDDLWMNTCWKTLRLIPEERPKANEIFDRFNKG